MSTASAAVSTPSPSAPPTKADLTSAQKAQRKALDAYVAAGRTKIPQLMKLFDGAYSRIDIKAGYPGTVRYRYVYAKQVDPDAVSAALKKQVSTLKSACDTALFPDMRRSGITTRPRVSYEYYSADGATLLSYTCKPSAG